MRQSAPSRPPCIAISREQEFGGQAPLQQVRGDSLLHFVSGNLRVKEYQHRRPGSAQGRAEDARLSRQFLERGQQRTERCAIRLVNPVFQAAGSRSGRPFANAESSNIEF